MSDSDTLTKSDVELHTGSGDHELFAHYYDTRIYDKLECSLSSKPIMALCGKVWPGQRDPDKFPICPECEEIVDRRSRD